MYYKITKTDGTAVGTTDSPNWIKRTAAGAYGTATKDTAEGIAFNSVAYNLVGHDIGCPDTVTCVETTTGEVLTAMQKQLTAMDATLAEILLNQSTNEEVAE